MRAATILLAAAWLTAAGCQAPSSFGQVGKPIVDQRKVADIACGPCAMVNWMSHGGDELQSALASFAADRTPVEAARHIIATYGKRRSATNPSVARYGPHNGGVGSVNLMIMARELLGDHLQSPPDLRGEFLHRLEGESTAEHLTRIRGWFAASIDVGVPVLFYLRAYRRSSGGGRPAMVFGHHVVVTSVGEVETGTRRIDFNFLDSASGRADRGTLLVAEGDFTAPTFTYRFEGERALATERVRTGRPLLEVRIPSYESANSPKKTVTTAHFATFATTGD